MAGRRVSLLEVQYAGKEYRDHILDYYPELDTFVEAEVPFLEFAREWVDRRVLEFSEFLQVPVLPVDHHLRTSAPVEAEPGFEEPMYHWPGFSVPWIVVPDDDLLIVGRGVVSQPGSRAAARGIAQVERPRPDAATPKGPDDQTPADPARQQTAPGSTV
jgi:hypothetical protein